MNASEKPSSALAQDTIHALAAIEAHAAAFPEEPAEIQTQGGGYHV